jgi:hypothetical protein
MSDVNWNTVLTWGGWILGVIGSLISVYQLALIRAQSKERRNFQYLLAALNSSAIAKQMRWQVTIALLPSLQSERDLEIRRLYETARSDMMDLAQQAFALERSIDSDSSAIQTIQRQAEEQIRRTNDLVSRSQDSPTRSSLPTNESGA